MRVINFAYLHNALDARVTVQRQGNCFVSSVALQEQIQRILNDGVDSGIYRIRQINLAAKSVLEANGWLWASGSRHQVCGGSKNVGRASALSILKWQAPCASDRDRAFTPGSPR
jgi:hypothetical protein